MEEYAEYVQFLLGTVDWPAVMRQKALEERIAVPFRIVDDPAGDAGPTAVSAGGYPAVDHRPGPAGSTASLCTRPTHPCLNNRIPTCRT